jgi:hypothetical protein
MTPADVVDSMLKTVEPLGREVVEQAVRPVVGNGGEPTDSNTDAE